MLNTQQAEAYRYAPKWPDANTRVFNQRSTDRLGLQRRQKMGTLAHQKTQPAKCWSQVQNKLPSPKQRVSSGAETQQSERRC